MKVHSESCKFHSLRARKTFHSSQNLIPRTKQGAEQNFRSHVIGGLESYRPFLKDIGESAHPGLEYIHEIFPQLEENLRLQIQGDKVQVGISPIEAFDSFVEAALSTGHFKDRQDVYRLLLQYSDRYIILFEALKYAHFGKTRPRTGQEIIQDLFNQEGLTSAMRQLCETDPSIKAGLEITFTSHPTFTWTKQNWTARNVLIKALQRGDEEEIISHIQQVSLTRARYSERQKPLEEAQNFLELVGRDLYHALTENQVEIYKLYDPTRIKLCKPLFHIGGWEAFDRDGNPFVTPQVSEEYALRKSVFILKVLSEESAQLTKYFTFNIQGLPELLARIQSKLQKTLKVKEAKLQEFQGALNVSSDDIEPHASLEEFKEDLLALRQISLNANKAHLTKVDKLIAGVDIFGFHLSEGKVRQNTGRHTKALNELIILENGTYSELSPDEKIDLINKLLDSDFPNVPETIQTSGLSGSTEEVIETLKMINTVQEEHGAKACQTYIMSNTYHGKLNTRELLLLWKIANPTKTFEEFNLDIVPLIETPDDIEEPFISAIAEGIADPNDELTIKIATIRKKFEWMLGFSDTGVRMGSQPAGWEIYKAAYRIEEAVNKFRTQINKLKKATVNRIAESFNIICQFFLGGGYATARGGRRIEDTHESIQAETGSFLLHLTVQGDGVYRDYGLKETGQYYSAKLLEALVKGIAGRGSMARISGNKFEVIDKYMEGIKTKFKQLYKNPLFAEFYREATPSRFTHNYGSRPPKHTSREDSGMEAIRAIPSVENFARVLQQIYIWYGSGTSLNELNHEQFELLKQIYEEGNSTQLNNYLGNLLYGLQYTEMFVTSHLMDDPKFSPLWQELKSEFELATRKVRELTGITEPKPLLDGLDLLELQIRNKARIPTAVLTQSLIKQIKTLNPEDPLFKEWSDLGSKSHTTGSLAQGRS
ncbi:MAG: phosphoenolpyruvate carboxylase [Candidatus Caenarcaniphilales bacterium]|nr:phosphoenolpyruvate carboxylase [Candidatus Caenarcaniphilales bacterium]